MSISTAQHFKHVSYLWDDAEAARLEGDEVGLLIYRSNLLGRKVRTAQGSPPCVKHGFPGFGKRESATENNCFAISGMRVKM